MALFKFNPLVQAFSLIGFLKKQFLIFGPLV